MSVHTVGGRGRRFLYRYAPRRSCWRSVGPHGECGFDAGGLPARFRKRPRAGALRSAGVHAAQRRSLRREARRRVGLPLDTIQVGMRGNMRRDQSSPGHFHKFMTESLPLCPLLGGGAAKGGGPDSSWIGALPWEQGGYLRTRGLGTGYPDGRKGGTEANRGITTPVTP